MCSDPSPPQPAQTARESEQVQKEWIKESAPQNASLIGRYHWKGNISTPRYQGTINQVEYTILYSTFLLGPLSSLTTEVIYQEENNDPGQL